MWLWDSSLSKAAAAVSEGMAVVDGLMAFTGDNKGNRITSEQPLYAASVTFLYAIWENYVEDVSIEAVRDMSSEGALDPADIPIAAKQAIQDGATAWDLSVHPGWQAIWRQKVQERAKGSEDQHSGPWGLNSAGAHTVQEQLFSLVGISPMPIDIPSPEESGSHTSPSVPDRINTENGTINVSHVLKRLIELRGELVHTGQSEETIYKHQVFWWKRFIQALVSATDQEVRRQTSGLVNGPVA